MRIGTRFVPEENWINGYDAIRILRNRGLQIPIIAQTAYARIEDEDISIKMGFDGYISKPIDRKKLFDLVDTYLTWRSEFLCNSYVLAYFKKVATPDNRQMIKP